MVYFKENYIFSRFQRGSNICPSPLWICACNVWMDWMLWQKLDLRKSCQFRTYLGIPICIQQPQWPDQDPNCFSRQNSLGSDNSGSNPLYFTFCIKISDMSSADNICKQFWPRSGPTFCPDLIGAQTVWHFRGYDKLKLNWCILTLR